MSGWLLRLRSRVAGIGQPLGEVYRLTFLVPESVFRDPEHPGRAYWERRALAKAWEGAQPRELVDVTLTWQRAGTNAPSGFRAADSVIVVRGVVR